MTVCRLLKNTFFVYIYSLIYQNIDSDKQLKIFESFYNFSYIFLNQIYNNSQKISKKGRNKDVIVFLFEFYYVGNIRVDFKRQEIIIMYT
jgi:hypothetical protein